MKSGGSVARYKVYPWARKRIIRGELDIKDEGAVRVGCALGPDNKGPALLDIRLIEPIEDAVFPHGLGLHFLDFVQDSLASVDHDWYGISSGL